MIRILAATLIILSSGCASHLSHPISKYQLAESIYVEKLPFVSGEEKYCGPASLSMILGLYQVEHNYEDITTMLYTPNKEGTYQHDIVTATRRMGLLSAKITDIESLLRELNDNRPAIVFTNQGLSFAPLWHYSVLKGYDGQKDELIFNSGEIENEKIPVSSFERMWARANNWAIIIYRPGELPQTIGELDLIAAAANLEQFGYLDAAKESYYAIAEKWPNTLAARIGLGNVYYAKKEYHKAYQHLLIATQLHPTDKNAQHNLSVVKEALRQQ